MAFSKQFSPIRVYSCPFVVQIYYTVNIVTKFHRRNYAGFGKAD